MHAYTLPVVHVVVSSETNLTYMISPLIPQTSAGEHSKRFPSKLSAIIGLEQVGQGRPSQDTA